MAKTTEQNALGGCLAAVILLLLTPVSAWWSGYVMLRLYNWFILPVQGAPALTIGNMLGFSLILSLMLSGLAKSAKTEDKEWVEIFIEAIARIIFFPLAFLFFGWLYQMWFMR